jgi:hypothetical protein
MSGSSAKDCSGRFEHVPNVTLKWSWEVFLIERKLAGIVFYVIGSKMPEK